MAEFLYSLDRGLFLLLNRGAANPVFDVVMPFITEANHWKLPLALAWLALMIFGGKKGRIAGLMAVIILTLSDQLSSSVLKPLLARIRPCFAVEGARLLITQSGSFSFPSSHASNNAALAFLFSVKYPRYKWIFITIAALVAYSRIYVGVHYPSDVAGGILLGVLCALAILAAEKGFTRLWISLKRSDRPRERNCDEKDLQ